jgi:hypothetical protein
MAAGKPSAAAARNTALLTLTTVQKAAHARFDYPGSDARLAQLDDHIATVRMIINHLFDESARSKEGR